MRIHDLSETEIVVGLRLKSPSKPNCFGTVVEIDRSDDNFAWVLWDGEPGPFSGFYRNNCDCGVVCDDSGNPIVSSRKNNVDA
jgi:hypothetical protein